MVVDSDTVLTSLILNSAVLPESVSPFPREIMKWSAELYRPFFQSINKSFDLVETVGVVETMISCFFFCCNKKMREHS